MEYGINLYCYGNELTLETQGELMKQNGFTKTFTFSSRKAACEKGAKLMSKYGIAFDTLHAPFGEINNIWKKTDDGDKTLSVLLDGVDKCKKVGAPTLIVHLSSGIPAPRVTDAGFKRFDKLMEYAEKNNVKIAFENQRFVANLASVTECYENAGFCWDTGHENCFAFGLKYMPIFGKRLCALHIHDNNKIFNKDEHLIPFDGKIDFEYVASEIAEHKYTGTLMLELERNNSNLYSDMTAQDYYKRAGCAVKRLDEEIKKHK